MPQKKHYGDPYSYEQKLEKVMTRLGVKKYNYNWDRTDAFVEFYYKDGFFRFDHSVNRASKTKLKLRYGSDVFAQLVFALEDLARIIERGIYDLSTWVSGLKALPPATKIEDWAQELNFNKMPESLDEAKASYKELAKTVHPDNGEGNHEGFLKLQSAYNQAKDYFAQ